MTEEPPIDQAALFARIQDQLDNAHSYSLATIYGMNGVLDGTTALELGTLLLRQWREHANSHGKIESAQERVKVTTLVESSIEHYNSTQNYKFLNLAGDFNKLISEEA